MIVGKTCVGTVATVDLFPTIYTSPRIKQGFTDKVSLSTPDGMVALHLGHLGCRSQTLVVSGHAVIQ